MIYNIIKKMH